MDTREHFLQICQEQRCTPLLDEPMSRHTTFRIGGPAEFFLQPTSEEQLVCLYKAAGELGLPVHLLGNGSNLLVSDAGVKGVVFCLGPAFSGVELIGENTVRAKAGSTLAQLCRFAQEHSLTGLEFAYGIPASVGGAVYMNAGAYGGEIRDALLCARHITPEGERGEFPAKSLDLSYRHSFYSGKAYIVTGADFCLSPGNRQEIRTRMEEILSRRKAKQPLEFPSAGSTFKRPEGAYAAQLIDECGLKGMRVGGAMVSEKHAGFLINAGGATCADMLELIRRVQEIVADKTGYQLEREVEIWQ